MLSVMWTSMNYRIDSDQGEDSLGRAVSLICVFKSANLYIKIVLIEGILYSNLLVSGPDQSIG